MSGLGRCPDLRNPDLGGSTVLWYNGFHGSHGSHGFHGSYGSRGSHGFDIRIPYGLDLDYDFNPSGPTDYSKGRLL